MVSKIDRQVGIETSHAVDMKLGNQVDMFSIIDEGDFIADRDIANKTRTKKSDKKLTLSVGKDDIERVKNGAINGCCFVVNSENYAEVMDFLFRMVFLHKKSIKDMLMEDSCALEPQDMRYFDERLFGMIPSYSYFKRYINALPSELKDDFEVTENEILESRYIKEMEAMAELGDGSPEENRRFGYWAKLQKVKENKIGRIEERKTKREIKNIGSFDTGVDKTLDIIRKIKDGDLVEIKKVLEIASSNDTH